MDGFQLPSNVFNCIQDGISILDLDLNILNINTSMQRWYSHKETITGEKCYKVYHNRKRPCEHCPTLKVIETGNAATEIVPYTAPADKRNGWQELSAFPFFDDNKKLVGIIEYVKDITIQKNLSSEILQLRKQLLALEAKNNILEAVVKQKENDKKQLEDNIVYNLSKLIKPSIERLKRSLSGTNEFDSIALLEYLLDEIVSPFSKKLSAKYLNLTSREIQIISLIKEGKTSKEIAGLLYVSTKTVDFHRANIRKKLGLTGKQKDDKSLRGYLLAYY